MSTRRSLPASLRALRRMFAGRARRERELDDELRFHLEEEAEGQEAAGLPPDAARLAARRDLGSVTVVQEAARDAWGWRGPERLLQDLTYGLRLLRRSPGFTSAALLSLALGIGANTAVFSLLDLVLLRALPVSRPEQLAIVAHAGTSAGPNAGSDAPATGANYAIYEMLRSGSRSFSGLVASWTIDAKLRTPAGPESAGVSYVTPNYFTVLGVSPSRGRAFEEADFARPVIVISHGLWQRRYGGAPDVLGQTLAVNGVPLTIVGVTPPEFFGLQRGTRIDAFLPFGLQPQISSAFGNRLTVRSAVFGLTIVGRLRPDVAVETARAESARLVEPWIEEFVIGGSGASREGPRAGSRGSWARIELLPGTTGLDALRRRFSKPLWILMAMVAVVLLIGCANVAGLLMSRASARRTELALRVSLGAGRARLIRQLLTESILLAVLGGVLGLLLALWGARAVVASLGTEATPLALSVDPDWRVLGFTALASLIGASLAGVMPAFRATRIDVIAALKAGARGRASDDPVGAWRKGLLALQMALAIILVVGAGLFARSLANIRGLSTGFTPDRLLLATFDTTGTSVSDDGASAGRGAGTDAPGSRTPGDRAPSGGAPGGGGPGGGVPGRRASGGGPSGDRTQDFYDRLVERVSVLPGVQSASLSRLGPLSGDDATRAFAVTGFTPREPGDSVVHMNAVTPRYFETMGAPLVSGRTFTERDRAGTPAVAIVSEAAARFYFPRGDAVGRAVRLGRGPDEVSLEVVGVAPDMTQRDLRDAPRRMVYLPCAQRPTCGTLEIRTIAEAAVLGPALRETVRAIAPDVTIATLRTVRAQVDTILVQERLIAMMSSLFGGVALLLAAIGLYGVVNYTVTARRHELGVRLALGARRGDVVRLLLRETGTPVIAGACIGVIASLALTQTIAGMLFGLPPRDPATFVLSTLVLLAVAAVAAFLPARRATRTDPAAVFRSS